MAHSKNGSGRSRRERVALQGVGHAWGLDRISCVDDPLLGHQVMQVFYPEGSINPSNKDAPQGGAGFTIGDGFESKPTHAKLSYKLFIPEDFEFALGGKLPGLYGGEDEQGRTASGGKSNAHPGFSARLAWKPVKGTPDATGTLYAYYPGKADDRIYGEAIGKWPLTPGRWMTLEQEVQLNDIGERNGFIRVWADGQLVADATGIVLRSDERIAIDGIMFSTFFGGHDPRYASPKDQSLRFADFDVEILQSPAVGVRR